MSSTTLIPTAERQSVMASAGYSFPEPVAVADGLDQAGMAWSVEQIPLAPQTTSLGVPVHGTDRLQMIARSDTGKMLGVAGDGYEIFQNAQLGEFGQAVLDSGDAKLTSCGSWRGDRMVWLAFQINGTVDLGGLDPVATYLYLISSHDGKSSSLQGLLSNLRIACTNQIPMILRGAKSIDRHIRLKHTAKLAGRVEDAQRALRISHGYMEAYQEQAERLMAHRLTGREFNRFMDRLIPLKPEIEPESRAALNRQETIAAIRSIWDSADNLDNIRGTRWAAFNAVAEYEDWGRRQRTSNSGDTAAQGRHMRMVMDNPVKDRALGLLAGTDVG